jgi:hypothetical protein
VLFCVLSPFWACLWYILLSHLVLRRRSSYFIQFLVFNLHALLVILMLKSGKVSL